mmetsp:Transcript_25898/g.60775  ORF Transcript_25898/g.60775 Transcript_25898/m.60775 type:complete len:98 (-) Transcript_25898:11-304(-)
MAKQELIQPTLLLSRFTRTQYLLPFTLGAQYTVADTRNEYLASTLREPQYVQFKLRQIPKSIQDKYNLDKYVDPSGYVYSKRKGPKNKNVSKYGLDL